MARLQFMHNELVGTATTIPGALSGVVQGSTFVVFVGTLSNTSTTISGVQDDLSNVGTFIGRAVYGTNGYVEAWYIKNVTAGSRTVTATYSATITNRFICVIEDSADLTAPFDQTSKLESQDSTNPHCPGLTTGFDNEYCVGFAAGNPAA